MPFLCSEPYYTEMLRENITGTLGNHICAYWRAAFSYTANNMSQQYSTKEIADLTMVFSADDFAGEEDEYVGESSLKDDYSLQEDINNVTAFIAPYLFSYCKEHAENGTQDYRVIFGKW